MVWLFWDASWCEFECGWEFTVIAKDHYIWRSFSFFHLVFHHIVKHVSTSIPLRIFHCQLNASSCNVSSPQALAHFMELRCIYKNVIWCCISSVVKDVCIFSRYWLWLICISSCIDSRLWCFMKFVFISINKTQLFLFNSPVSISSWIPGYISISSTLSSLTYSLCLSTNEEIIS